MQLNYSIYMLCFLRRGLRRDCKADKYLRRSASPFQAFSVRSLILRERPSMLIISQLHGITELGAEALFFIFEPPTMGMLRKHYNF
jgi:hypothetical protein